MTEATVENVGKKRTIVSREDFVTAVVTGAEKGMTRKEVCDNLLGGMNIQTFGQRLSKMNAELLEAGEDQIELKDGRSGGTRAASFVELVKQKKLEAIKSMETAIKDVEESV